MIHFDAIVIGSGNAGLTAAVTLQKKGVKTLLLERHNIPGGCATSFMRGRFEFEVALHQLSGIGSKDKPFILQDIFTKLGIMDKLEVVEDHDIYRFVLPGEIDITLPASWPELHQTLFSIFPEEKEAIKNFLKLCQDISLESFTSLNKAQKENNLELLKSTCPNYIKYGLSSAKDVLDEFFNNPDLKAVIGAYWYYVGLPLKDVQFPDLAARLYIYASYKPCLVKGGAQAISNALLETFLEAGGQVKLNCGAHKILTKNNKITGVQTENNDIYSCNLVISNTSPIHTFTELLDSPEPHLKIANEMKSRRLGTSAFILYLGLDCSPKDIGLTSASSFILSDRDDEIAYNNMKKIVPASHLMITCHNFNDLSFAPEGKTIISLLSLQYAEPWEKISPENYTKAKYDFAETLLDLAEKTYPNIRKHIEEAETASPLTIMRYLNTPGGSIYGFDKNAHDNAKFSDVIDTVEGLYMAGCWNCKGGFQPTYRIGIKTANTAIKHFENTQTIRKTTAHA